MRILLLTLLLTPTLLFSVEPKRELRAAWIATVFNIDWPSTQGAPKETQQAELIKILDTLQELKFNAAILQVKPTSDAFYKSKLSPWSRYLTGTQGKDPGYDPLAFFIEEAQKRAIETHVWVNPYRVLNGEVVDTLSKNHIARKNPDWVITYNNRYYFDPGNPAVQEYVTKEVMEIVDNYDIDALHMDDYFYPYISYSNRVAIPFNDNASWKKHGKKFKSREDWRRDSVNKFVQTLGVKIKKSKSYVKFGISPFGVWRNKSEDPKGSDTLAGQTNYDHLYADVIKWIDNQWIDYVMPQLYWHFDTKAAPYGVLVKWWNDIVKDKVNLYIGLGVYKLSEQNWPVTHIKEQVDFERKFPHVDGVSYYSAKWIVQDTKKIQEYLKKTVYTTYALVPKNKNLTNIKPFQVEDFILSTKNKENILTWKNIDKDLIRYFVIYRFEKGEKPDPENAKNIIAIVSAKQKPEFKINDYDDKYTYGITSVSRLHYESTLLTLEDTEKQKSLNIIDQLLEEAPIVEKR